MTSDDSLSPRMIWLFDHFPRWVVISLVSLWYMFVFGASAISLVVAVFFIARYPELGIGVLIVGGASAIGRVIYLYFDETIPLREKKK